MDSATLLLRQLIVSISLGVFAALPHDQSILLLLLYDGKEVGRLNMRKFLKGFVFVLVVSGGEIVDSINNTARRAYLPSGTANTCMNKTGTAKG